MTTSYLKACHLLTLSDRMHFMAIRNEIKAKWDGERQVTEATVGRAVNRLQVQRQHTGWGGVATGYKGNTKGEKGRKNRPQDKTEDVGRV